METGTWEKNQCVTPGVLFDHAKVCRLCTQTRPSPAARPCSPWLRFCHLSWVSASWVSNFMPNDIRRSAHKAATVLELPLPSGCPALGLRAVFSELSRFPYGQ